MPRFETVGAPAELFLNQRPPLRPYEVQDPESLKPGRTYWQYSNYYGSGDHDWPIVQGVPALFREIVVLGESRNDWGYRHVPIRTVSGWGHDTDLSLADAGLTADDRGTWNSVFFLTSKRLDPILIQYGASEYYRREKPQSGYIGLAGVHDREPLTVVGRPRPRKNQLTNLDEVIEGLKLVQVSGEDRRDVDVLGLRYDYGDSRWLMSVKDLAGNKGVIDLGFFGVVPLYDVKSADGEVAYSVWIRRNRLMKLSE